MANEISFRLLTADDGDLAEVAESLNRDDWEAGEQPFTAESLKKFLQADPGNIYMIGYLNGALAAAFHSYRMQHPDGRVFMYIDEVDTAKPFRRHGVATAMMKEMLRIAKERGYNEVWLGTEHDNEPAKALYKSLNPTEIENGPIYSWKIS
jgi:ribosomal protein S18 acetylase RimI-like enzyme